MWNLSKYVRMIHTSPLCMDNNKMLLSKLRKKTGYTFTNCKKALETCNNDIAQAEKWLHDQALSMGWEKATKLADRPAFQGLIGVYNNEKSGVLVEVNCETDFVARNDVFRKFVFDVTSCCYTLAKKQTNVDDPIAKLYLSSSDMNSLKKPDGTSLENEAALIMSQVGEKVSLRRALCFNVSDNILITGCTHPYISSGVDSCLNAGQYGALLLYTLENPSPEAPLLVKQLCQHIIGRDPLKVGNVEDDKPIENKEEEKVMIHQEFMMDPEVTVLQILVENGITLKEFARFKFAECPEKKEEDIENVQVAQAVEYHRSMTQIAKFDEEKDTERKENAYSDVTTQLKLGCASFMMDAYNLIKLMKSESDDKIFNYDLNELRLRFEFRYEISKYLPMLFIAMFPFGGLVVIYLGYKFPHRFLTPHLWVKSVKKRCLLGIHEDRLDSHASFLNKLINHESYNSCIPLKNIIKSVKNKELPNTNDILECQYLFKRPNGSLCVENLEADILKIILDIHGLQHHIFQHSKNVDRLESQIAYLLLSDRYIKSIGGVNCLTFDTLFRMCFLRGTNTYLMTEENMKTFLNDWIEITTEIGNSTATSVLFLPVFLYYHPSNIESRE